MQFGTKSAWVNRNKFYKIFSKEIRKQFPKFKGEYLATMHSHLLNIREFKLAEKLAGDYEISKIPE